MQRLVLPPLLWDFFAHVSAGTIRGKSYEKNKDFEFLGFTFNRWLLFASFFISSASEHLPESVVPPPAAAAVKVLVLPCQHICGINARVYIIVGIPSFEPPPDLPADA